MANIEDANTVMKDALTEEAAGKLLQGTCGWSCESLLRCGKLYPKRCKTAEERLPIYSTAFACVEVDSSCYAIPRPAVTARWAAAVPPGFRFHFKAFSIFCCQAVSLDTLPAHVREQLPQRIKQAARRVTLTQLPAQLQDALWQQWHDCLEPVIKAGRMGCVLFQYQLSFMPSRGGLDAIRAARRRLAPNIPMAVEFRHRGWFVDDEMRATTVAALREMGVCLVASDDLRHELFQNDRAQTGLPPGDARVIMPIALTVTQPAFGYVRVHRRHGTSDRVLQLQEIEAWAARLREYSPRGPIYFLWGTDWEDAPLRNAAALAAAAGPQLALDWKGWLRRQAPRKGSIQAFLTPAQPGAVWRPGSGGEGAGDAAEPFVFSAACSSGGLGGDKGGGVAPKQPKRGSIQALFAAAALDPLQQSVTSAPSPAAARGPPLPASSAASRPRRGPIQAFLTAAQLSHSEVQRGAPAGSSGAAGTAASTAAAAPRTEAEGAAALPTEQSATRAAHLGAAGGPGPSTSNPGRSIESPAAAREGTDGPLQPAATSHTAKAAALAGSVRRRSTRALPPVATSVATGAAGQDEEGCACCLPGAQASHVMLAAAAAAAGWEPPGMEGEAAAGWGPALADLDLGLTGPVGLQGASTPPAAGAGAIALPAAHGSGVQAIGARGTAEADDHRQQDDGIDYLDLLLQMEGGPEGEAH